MGAQTQRNSKTQIPNLKQIQNSEFPNEETNCVLAEKSQDIRDETFRPFEFVISNLFGPWSFGFLLEECPKIRIGHFDQIAEQCLRSVSWIGVYVADKDGASRTRGRADCSRE